MMNMVLRPAIEAQAGETFADFLARDADHGQIAVRAAILLGHPELHQPHFAEQLDELEREAIGLVDLGGDRRHVLATIFRTLSRKAICSSVKLMRSLGHLSCGKSKKGLPLNG